MCQPLSTERLLESERHFVEYTRSRGLTPSHPLFGLFRGILISGSDLDAKDLLIQFMEQENSHRVCKRCLGDGCRANSDGTFTTCTLCYGSGSLIPAPA